MTQQSEHSTVVPTVNKEERDDSSVVFYGIPRTEVFINGNGDIVIKQCDKTPYATDEMFVYFPAAYADKIIQAIKEKVNELPEEN
ncbi:MAG: hypothetical protein LBE13_19270 [Bacteroidales bacterium]|jgi:hypothetical protein|nr:hypothetical protein [Bacteroidales bacterium]